jgi:hypothetical protein
MDLTLYRWAPLLLILMTGCSSSGLFGGRAPEERNSTAETFESRRDGADSSEGRSLASRRAGAASSRSSTTVDSGLRRQKVATQLAAAARFEKAGDSRAARAAYERVLELEPAHSLANYQLAVLADDEGRFDEAEAHYRILLSKTPKNPDLLASLGWSYFLQGRYDESERTLREALTVDSRHPTALYNLGWLYGTLGDYDQALAIFRTAGTEEEAAHAIAELFPRGRPASAPETPTGAPRNPFKLPSDNLASGKNREMPGLSDRMPPGPISAPAPWQKKSDRPIAASAAPRTRPPGHSVQPSAIQSAGHFDEVFSQLDSQTGPTINPSGRSSTGDQVKSLAPPPEFLEPPHAGADGIATVAHAQPADEPGNGEGPVITPKKSPPSGTAATAQNPAPAEGAGGLADGAAVPRTADSTVGRGPPSRSLPDWPYRNDPSGTRSDSPRTDPPVRPSARTTAAQLGLSVGPGGLMFPITTEGSPPARALAAPGSSAALR